jgi:hypothetical protein
MIKKVLISIVLIYVASVFLLESVIIILECLGKFNGLKQATLNMLKLITFN